MNKKFYTITNKSFSELEVKTEQELWDKVKGEYKGLSFSADTVFEKAEGTDNKFNVVMSTDSMDRHGDVVIQNWDLKSFKKNPVLLDSHNYVSIEHILGKVNKPKVKDNKLQGEIEFMLDNPKGMLAYKMALGGYLNATSVGFIPHSFDDNGNIEKSELLELSAVSVPANAEALFEKSVEEIGEEIEETPDKETKEDVGLGTTNPVELETVSPDTILDTKPKKKTKLDILKEMAEKERQRQHRREAILKATLGDIHTLIGEEKSGRNSAIADRANRKRVINKAVRNLLKVK